MLEIKKISWRNFLSYGDYDTTIDISTISQCLISGYIIEEGSGNYNNITSDKAKSNGAGKSTIPNAIQWCLFGRTMHSNNPGDKVINWYTGKDCRVSIEFKNGDMITRTRKTGGKNELFYIRSGEENKLISDTISTSKNQQAILERDFKLDWDIFCGSIFFNQYGKSWMEMSDSVRKNAIERILHIDRFKYYASVSKEKSEGYVKRVEKLRSEIDMLNSNIEDHRNQIQKLKEASERFNDNKKIKIQRLIDKAKKLKEEHDGIIVPDIVDLENKWKTAKEIENKIQEAIKKSNKLEGDIYKYKSELDSVNVRIDNWNNKAGKVCVKCDQTVPHDHIDNKVKPLTDKAEGLKETIKELREKLSLNVDKIGKAKDILKSRTPTMSVERARDIERNKNKLLKEIKNIKSEAINIKNEENSYNDMIDNVETLIEEKLSRIAKHEKQIERDNFASKHFSYIYKAYNDRSKIKSFVFQEHIPFINERLNYYLDIFNLDVRIELTNALGIKNSNMWGYEFESGGERKRTDIAFMLAMFDFHESIYGRQSNILVLDEVDGRMDTEGIEALISIIKNDLAHRVESIFIISHRDIMFDVFPDEIKVIRSDRFSQLLLN